MTQNTTSSPRIPQIKATFYHAAEGVIDFIPVSGIVTALGIAAIGAAKAFGAPENLTGLAAGVVGTGLLTGAAIAFGATQIESGTKAFANAVATSYARDLKRTGMALSIALPLLASSATTMADIKYLNEQEQKTRLPAPVIEDFSESGGGWSPESSAGLSP